MRGLGHLLAAAGIFAKAAMAADKAVFAHYMIAGCTQEHAQQDIDDALAMGIDAFAINIGDSTGSWVSTALANLFPYAEQVGFKLFISMDVEAAAAACTSSGTSCGGPSDYQWIWDAYKGSSAYYQVNGLPLISTFSSGGYESSTWTSWKSGLANDMFFMPDFDETDGYYDAADGWWSYWGDVVDGIFSWESTWPEVDSGTTPGSVSRDVTVLAGAKSNDKLYMAGLSPLQFKNSYGGNWYRLGDDALPARMANILSMSPAPDFVEVITWNDGPESHYIGNIWPEANSDTAPGLYASQATWPHAAWQPLVSSFTTAFKNGQAASKMTPADGSVAVGSAWYRTELSSASCSGATAPSGWDQGSDLLYWAVVLNPSAGDGYTVTVQSGSGASSTTDLSAGLNYGSSSSFASGAQKVTVKDANGNVILSATGGMCVSDGCPNSIYNANYQVLPFSTGDATMTCTAW